MRSKDMDYSEHMHLPAGNVADSNTIDGVMDPEIKPLDPKMKMIGRALTVKCFPGDNLALHQGIAAAQKGDVIVFDCRGYTRAGHFGDMMAAACSTKGIAGVVIDGSCRDKEDIISLGFPVFARGVCPAPTVKESLAVIGKPVTAGGVTVKTGDIIFGDCDGIVVIPEEDSEKVFEKAEAKYAKEQKIREELLAGKSSMEIYGFDKLVEQKQNA